MVNIILRLGSTYPGIHYQLNLYDEVIPLIKTKSGYM